MAIALIGLICVGLLGLGGILFFTQANRAQEEAAATIIPTIVPPTFTPSATFTATPTDTPLPTPTSTPVIFGAEETEEPAQQPVDTPTTDPNATPTNTRVLQTATATSTPEMTETPTPPLAPIPDSGGVLQTSDNDFLVWIGGGLLGLLIFGAVYRFRSIQTVSQK